MVRPDFLPCQGPRFRSRLATGPEGSYRARPRRDPITESAMTRASGRTALAPAITMILAAFAALAAGAGAQSDIAPAGPAGSARDAAAAEQVDQLFAGWHRPDSPGAAVLVLRHGEIVHARGYGMASLEHGVPIRTTTVFDIASVSKQFAAFGIALLAEEGRLGLDDDVRRYIPELPDFGATITIRHLVHHTSGLRDWPGTLRMAGWDFMDVLSFEQILAMAFHQRELNFPPGSEYAYSNTGYNLLAEVVARVTGRSFRDWTRERIFEPLGMRQTHFHDDWTEIVPGRAESYRRARDGGFQRVVSSLTAVGSSSLFTTIEDLARWIGNVHEPVVGASVLPRMTERGVLAGGDTIDYAFGLFVGEYRGARTVSHSGSWAGYRSMFLRFPEHGLDIVVLGNTSDLSAGVLAYRIADVHLADRLGPASVATPTPLESLTASTYAPAPAELDALAGEYRSAELQTSYHLVVDDGRLVARHFRTGLLPLQPVDQDVFLAPGFGRIQFVRDEDDRVIAFTANSARIRGLRFERVD
jgi:CubicO group peptidase (beta-lactamase class C family)